MSNTDKQMMSPALAAERVAAGLAARRSRERRFRIYGRIAIGVALAFLVTLFVSIFSKGIPGFFQHYVTIEVTLDRAKLDPAGDLSVQSLYDGDARWVIRKALFEAAEASGRSGRKAAGKIISQGAEQRLRSAILDDPDILDTTQSMTFAVDDDVDSFLRGYIKRETPEKDRRINDKMIGYIDTLNEKGLISFRFSDYLIFGSASRNAEMAGIFGAFVGSILTLAVCLVLAFPLGVATAVYLEEFAPKNRITELIEININNLAAVPSVVFGILGLAIFIGIFGMPRSIPLIGGVVLALMTLRRKRTRVMLTTRRRVRLTERRLGPRRRLTAAMRRRRRTTCSEGATCMSLVYHFSAHASSSPHLNHLHADAFDTSFSSASASSSSRIGHRVTRSIFHRCTPGEAQRRRPLPPLLG